MYGRSRVPATDQVPRQGGQRAMHRHQVLAKPEGGRGEPRHQPQRAGRLVRLHPELLTGVVAGQGLERRARKACCAATPLNRATGAESSLL